MISYSTLIETILYRFRDIAIYLSKFVDFNLHHASALGAHSNFADIFGVINSLSYRAALFA